jgi:hypothetical protein
MVIQRDTGSKEFGHDYNDCKILIETDDLTEALSKAVDNGYEPQGGNYRGVRILKEVTVTAMES